MKQLGTFSGVFVPSFEAILGAVLFLILPLLVGAMGLWKMVAIVILANTATLATAFSISDCTTNLERVGPGGMYAVSKRSLGRAFGGSIGIQLFLAQAVSIGFYAAGFAEPLQRIVVAIPAIEQLVEHFGLSVLTQKQILSTIIGLVAFGFAVVGANFIVKIQMVIFVILVVAVVTIFFSPSINPPNGGEPVFAGSFNLTGTGLAAGFFGAFAIFFPAVTGIDAGVGMSGVLRNPRRSLGKGTFIAIGITLVVYLAVTVIFSRVRPELLVSNVGAAPSTLDIFIESRAIYAILLTGILVATGSSALSYFMTAPRTAQALARDGILPKALNFLGRDFTKDGQEPRWATVLTFALFLPVIWAGDITFISLVVGICFLTVYGWVNLAAFLERVSGNPSFRPTAWGHWAINLYGFLICMVVISLFNPLVGVGVLTSQIVVFVLLLKYRSGNRLEGVWWGALFAMVTWALRRLGKIVQGTKNWRPIVSMFVMSDRPRDRKTAEEMGQRIADYKGMFMVNTLDQATSEASDSIIALSQVALPGDLTVNTVLLPLDTRIRLMETVGQLIYQGKNVLLYKHGALDSRGEPGSSDEPSSHGEQGTATEERIDVYWKGQENGNLMALLAYIIRESDRSAGAPVKQLRLIRKLHDDQDPEECRRELQRLLERARLTGEIVVLERDDAPFYETVRDNSSGASLILLGMPGTRVSGLARVFSLDERFFSKQIEQYESLPPILFVKAATTVDLLE